MARSPAETSDVVAVLTRLMRPSSVAIVGGSADPSKISGRPVKFLRRGNYRGEAFLVNPSLPAVEGFVSLASVADLPHPPDVAFVATGAQAAVGAVRDLAALGTPCAIVLASGYAEGGSEGAGLQQALTDAAGKMRLVGPNTLGMINLTDGVLLSASDALESPGLLSGSIGVASQSGGIMASLLSRAAAAGIGLSKLIATGNEADIEVADCVEYFAQDSATSVIALYLETLRNPGRFLDAARLATSSGKQVVCYKVGRSEAGALAATSHTGALAGSDRVYDALFEKAGVLRVATFAELLEIPATLAIRKRVAGRRVGVLTTTGGAATLIADACGALGLSLPLPDRSMVEKLKAILPDSGVDLEHNPIDLTLAGTREEVMVPVIEQLTASDSFDMIVVVIGASAVAQPRLVAHPLIACANRPGSKPILAYVSPHLPEVIGRLNRAGVPAFQAPESCAAALAALAHGVPTQTGVSPEPSATPDAGGRLLNENEAKELLANYGIKSPRRAIVTSPELAEASAENLREPIALKVMADGLTHKSDVGGVVLGVTRADVAEQAATMLSRVAMALPAVRIAGLLLEEMHTGQELLLGMVRDPALGPVLVLGSGGIAAELLDDTVMALPPLELVSARAMIDRLRLAPLLYGARGRAVTDIEALAATIVAFSEFTQDFGDRLVEAEINPLLVLEQGQGVLALDALVRLSA